MSTSQASPHRPEKGFSDPQGLLQAKRLKFHPYDMEVGPLGHLHEERRRLASVEFQHFEVRPLGATLGGEISGVDLCSVLAEGVVAELRQALNDFKVIFFRNQPLTPAQHVAFARHFGELEIHPFIPPNAEHPELVHFAKSADLGGYENGWHADVTWRECPSMGAVLHAVEVPRTGGDTLFADMTAAYEGLEPELKDRIDGMMAVHDYSNAFGHMVSQEKKQETRAKFPPVEHPVVRTHPETGRKILYVNRFFVDHLVGVSKEESIDLMKQLCRQAEFPEYQVRWHWEKDSVAFWDNRAVQHYASSDYWPDVRVMERASVIGDRPF